MEGYGNENPGAFQSTRPLRGATSQPITKVELLGEFQPTRPLRGATQVRDRRVGGQVVFQPTRPLRGATVAEAWQEKKWKISTHAPLAGRDYGGDLIRKLATIFQPTRPLRGATDDTTL